MDVWTGALGSLLPKLGELLKEDNLPTSVKVDIELLESELMRVHYYLNEKAEEQHSKMMKIWARQVRDLSYSMENVIDIFLLHMENKEFTKKMANSKIHPQIASKIKVIRCQAQNLIEQHYQIGAISSQCVRVDRHRSLAPFRDEGELVGIEETVQELTEILCEGKKQLKILSIVGFGGFGKTTLAMEVYQRICGQFNYKNFVSISSKPDMKGIFYNILRQIDEQFCRDGIRAEAEAEDKLIDEIRELLQNKSYLIVIDDLWNTGDWDRILCSLPKNDCGSRIITTTRVNGVAKICCSGHGGLIYEIKPLGYLDCKRLFLNTCVGREISCHESHDALTEVVDKIWKTCGGMPLAIKSSAPAIASLLARKVNEPWQEMMEAVHSRTWEHRRMEDLMEILLYSYFNLPRTLRGCLLYLAASTKNQRIQMDNLVRKWIVEGLIPEETGCSREEVASRYFDELINSNVIRPVEYGDRTYEVNYMMLHALRRVAREENFVTFLPNFDISKPRVYDKPVRLFIECSDSESSIDTERMDLTDVRSVTMLGPAKWVSFKYLEYVRVLDLDGCDDFDNSAMDDICRMILLKYLSLKQTEVTEIPPKISDLRYLKTLAVRNTPITTLPPQIGELQNLETLDVRRTQISNLPPEIRKLQNLKTLDVRQTRVKELPNELVQLSKLAHLHFGQNGSLGGVKLPVGSSQLKSVKAMGTVDSRECSESDMKEISKLAEVRELEVVLYDGPADKEQNVKLLSCVGECGNLQSLTIYGDSNPGGHLPASSNFPLLVKLKVAGRFVKVPQWVSQLAALQQLDIRVCELVPDDLMILGKVPRLSSLALALVASLPKTQVAITSSAGFVKLEVFTFDCRVPWVTFQEGAMPSLKHLQMRLYGGPVGKIPSGTMRLQSLSKIILRYSSQYASSRSVAETVSVIRNEAASHANLIELSINETKIEKC